MSFILQIDTASENAHVSLAKDGQILHWLSNESQKEHAAFLQAGIQHLIKSVDINIKEVDAFAVTSGPGSYTGLRVGMASAKGLCYALKKPLITIGTLELLTASALQLFPGDNEDLLYCPMIDARRMEVFTAVYKSDLSIELKPCAMILDEFSFEKELKNNQIVFFGSGSEKWKQICSDSYQDEHAIFKTVSILPKSFGIAAYALFSEKKFTELAYSEPVYLKEFQTVTKS